MNGKLTEIIRMGAIGCIVGLCAVGYVVVMEACSTSRKAAATAGHTAAAATCETQAGATVITGSGSLHQERGKAAEESSLERRETESSRQRGRVDIERDSSGAVKAVSWDVSGNSLSMGSRASSKASESDVRAESRRGDTTRMEAATLEKAESREDTEQEERATETEAGGSGIAGKLAGWGVIALFIIFLYRIVSPYIDRLWRR